jgi:prephenate dehydratase
MNEVMNDYPAKLRVAIQGVPGAFHDMAARQYFPENNIEIVACDTFRDAFDAVLENKADSAMVAIENSLAGSLLPNYTLLKNSGLLISGEIYLRIEQNFMALPGQTIDDIKEVHSHPIAIIQCDEFLEPMRKKGVKIIDSIDTALSARLIADNKIMGTAAIASDLAAEMYKLEIIKKGVETNKRNFTRFLSLAPETLTSKIIAKRGKNPDKASVCFSLPHQTGSLSQILSVFAFYKINLTKIQSAPIVGTEWEYFFYIDLIFEDYEMYIKALVAVKPLIDQLQILGEYISAKP